MRIGIRKAHSKNCYGATGYLDEYVESRVLYPRVVELLSPYHTIIDCTPSDELGWGEWNTGVAIANKSNLDLFFSLHFNSANGDPRGSEVCVYSLTGTAAIYGKKICSNLASLGFSNRGVKQRTDLAETANISCPSMVIETCFVQESDGKLYKQLGVEKIARAIANAIDSRVSLSVPTPVPTPPVTADKYYRVRKSWGDSASQKGAYSVLDNAIAECKKHSGYSVFDYTGKAVYPVVTAPTFDKETITKTYAENGKATIIVDKLNVRDIPHSTKGNRVAEYIKNESFYYHTVHISECYVWVEYLSNSGHKRYVAVKNKTTGERYANCV